MAAAMRPADPSQSQPAPDWLAALPSDLQGLYRYWDAKRGARRMPARGDLDPLDLVPYLPGLLLVDVVADDRLYVYRLVGTREVELRGKDPTGLAVVDHAFCADASHALRNYDQVVLSRAPWIDDTPHLSVDRQKLSLESIFLPLSSNGEEVDKILVYAAHKVVDLPLR